MPWKRRKLHGLAYIYLFTGGEPLVRKKDLIRLCETHPDCVFSAFTNGTLIDEAFADEMDLRKGRIPEETKELIRRSSVLCIS